MTDVHRVLAIVALATALVGLAWSVGLAVARRPADRPYVALIAAGVVAALVTGLLGGLVLGTGHTPDDALHLVYGLVSFVALPIAAVFAAGRTPRGQAIVMSIGWIVEAGVIVRLFQTG